MEIKESQELFDLTKMTDIVEYYYRDGTLNKPVDLRKNRLIMLHVNQKKYLPCEPLYNLFSMKCYCEDAV